jgi:hypothetical protein
VNKSELVEKVAALWDEVLDQDLANQDDISFETFLGAHYAIGTLAERCELTEEGLEIVQQAFDELSELVGNDEDEDDEEEEEDEEEDD